MKIKDMWTYMKNFFDLIRKDHPMILFYIFIGAFASATIPFISLYFSSRILDSLLLANTELAIQQVTIMLSTIFIFGCINRACFQMIDMMSTIADDSIWKQTTYKAFVLEYEQFEKTETLDSIRKTENGSNGAGGVDSQIRNTYIFISYLFSIIYSLTFTLNLFIKGNISSLLPTILLILIFIFMMVLINKMQAYIAQKAVDVQRANVHGNSVSSYIIGTMIDVQNGKDIRLFKMQPLLLKWYKWMNQFIINTFTDYAHLEGLNNAKITFISQLFGGCVYIYLGYNVLNGAISVGNVLMYAGAIISMTSNISTAIQTYNDIAYRFEYLNTFSEFINAPNMHYDGTLPIEKRNDFEYEFEFKNVSFKYPNTDNYVLKNVNLKFDLNKRYAIIGQNGAGKSTLIKLLCRLYEVSEGEILLNGINIKKYDYEEYTNIFSCVFQDFKLFPLPLDENIACSEQVDQKRCDEVLKQVDLYDKVMNWPDKQHTLLYKNLGEGINVSGGEAQKIAIARALYKDAPMVIMDEPTAALDPLAEAEIYESFNAMIQNKTAIFISHRMSSCRFCDEIVVFDDGQIVQQGTHDELVHEDGLYSELWNAQAQYYV